MQLALRAYFLQKRLSQTNEIFVSTSLTTVDCSHLKNGDGFRSCAYGNSAH